jgi:serine/threonine protein kinase
MWGLGCLLYEMLALEHPFQGSNLAELSVHVMNAEYKPAPARYSADLQALLRALLSATPADRPTAAALLTTPVLR